MADSRSREVMDWIVAAMTWAITSTAMRSGYGTSLGALWWQAIIPQSLPPMTMDTLMDACTPMLVRYSTWIGETLRRTL